MDDHSASCVTANLEMSLRKYFDIFGYIAIHTQFIILAYRQDFKGDTSFTDGKLHKRGSLNAKLWPPCVETDRMDSVEDLRLHAG